MCQRNKKDYQLTLHDGQQLELAVTDMFSVAVFRQGQALLHIRFKPLSSLNNLEMQPVYRVASLLVADDLQGGYWQEWLECMLTVYRYYTRGSIHPWRPALK